MDVLIHLRVFRQWSKLYKQGDGYKYHIGDYLIEDFSPKINPFGLLLLDFMFLKSLLKNDVKEAKCNTSKQKVAK